MRTNGPRIAIVADYLNQRGGAEWVVAVLHELFPDAPIYTTIADPVRLWPGLRGADIRVSWMQRLPGVLRRFKYYLPFYYLAVESMRLQEYDLVVSSSCAFGLGARARVDATHICYCHTPARFVWNYAAYVEKEALGPAARAVLPWMIGAVRRRDVAMARRPNYFVANSSAVANRIRIYYGREAVVIPPPVDINRFTPTEAPGDYYLVVSRLNPYKRIDLAVAAFNALRRPLLVVGEGPDRARLERMAGPTIRFAGWLGDAEVARAYAGCRALVFPGEEDFGIAPVEAGAAGRPVVAYQGGGALDTVLEGETGVFFREPTVEALTDAVARLERQPWSAARIRANAEHFGVDRFKGRFGRFVMERLAAGGRSTVPCAA